MSEEITAPFDASDSMATVGAGPEHIEYRAVIAGPGEGQSPPVTNGQFMRVLLKAAPQGSYGWVCNFIGAPRPGAEWTGRPYRGGGELEQEVDTWGRYNTYFSVGAMSMGQDGEQARRKSLFARLLALVVDDADVDQLPEVPSYIIETSPGKNQVGVFLDADDPDCANSSLVDALMHALFVRGGSLGDPSGNNGVRYVRLPVGSNLKRADTWQHVVSLWNPAKRMTLKAAAELVGIDLDSLREAAAAKVSGGMELGPGVGQAAKLEMLTANIMQGVALHESINEYAASMVASGTHAGAVTSNLRGLMKSSNAARDARWQERYDDIPRSVRTAEEKFKVDPAPAQTAYPVVECAAVPVSKPKLLVNYSTMKGMVRSTKWLIKGFLEAGALSMLFGPSNSLKSFIAIDQACCVVTGKAWHGRAVKKGPVVIVAGEGKNGICNRVRAWEIQNKREITEEDGLLITESAVLMLDVESVLTLTDEIDQFCKATNRPPALIVIDTLARNFGVGDENSAKDANAFIVSIDTNLRNRYSHGEYLCHVLIVHHSGHTAGRERGSTAFPGAMDQRFEAKRFNDDVTYINKKMKDGEAPADIQFTLVGGIYLGDDLDGAVMGAALTSKLGILDAELVKGKNGIVTVGEMLKLVAGSKVPSSRKLREQFDLNATGADKAFKAMVDMGLIFKPPEQTARYQMTKEGLVLLSSTGHMAIGELVAQDEEEDEE